MPRPDFVPRRDNAFLSFARNFAGRISADPSAYGVSVSDAAALQTLADRFISAMTAASEPATRTRPAVAEKNSARAALAAEIRRLGRRIRAEQSVSDAQRIDLGLTPSSAAPPYNGPPRTRPLLCVRPLSGNRARLRLCDADSPTHRGKPAGAVGAVLFIQIGAVGGGAETPYLYAGIATTAIHMMKLPSAATRKEVWITARWFNLRGEEGPQAHPARTIGLG